jgi:hypothetical protein
VFRMGRPKSIRPTLANERWHAWASTVALPPSAAGVRTGAAIPVPQNEKIRCAGEKILVDGAG